MNILYISWRAPYNNVSHAGGKTFNYYIKGMAKKTNNSIALLTIGNPTDKEKCDCKDAGIETYFLDEYMRTPRNWREALSKKWIFGITCGMYGISIVDGVKNALSALRDNGYKPEVIVMEWTQITILVELIKSYYPNARYVSSEHDVSFLGLERKYLLEKNPVRKLFRFLKYRVLYKRECAALKECDLILCHNEKDVNLLGRNNVHGAKMIVPYYDQYQLMDGRLDSENKYVTFFGAMAREENYKSVIWFIENVMPQISDLDFKFCVLGSNPPDFLRQYESNKILVTGFVEDITEYLNKTKIAVLPLVLGAGIKVKVLEFAAAGIPIITNEIGIEGIPLERDKEYLHCESAKEFADTIRKVLTNQIDLASISKKEVAAIHNKFELSKSLDNYIKWLEK